MPDTASYSPNRAQQSRWFHFLYFSAYAVGTAVEAFTSNAWTLAADTAAATTRRNFCSVIQRHECPSNCRLIIYQNFGLTNFAARTSVRWFIRLQFPRSLNTCHESWRDTMAICFVLPLVLALNT